MQLCQPVAPLRSIDGFFKITRKYLQLKIKYAKDSARKARVYLACPILYVLQTALECPDGYPFPVYRLCPRMIHRRCIPARCIFPRLDALTPFSESSKARAFEASIRCGGSTRAATFHIAGHGRRVYPRTTCCAPGIRRKSTSPKARLLGVQVPNELPLKSNSRFAPAKATTRARYVCPRSPPRQTELRLHLSTNLRNEKVCSRCCGYLLELTNN